MAQELYCTAAAGVLQHALASTWLSLEVKSAKPYRLARVFLRSADCFAILLDPGFLHARQAVFSIDVEVL